MKKILFAAVCCSHWAFAQTTHPVISQIYPGGGNSGATYNRDFVELYNPTSVAVDLTGWSLQYSTATGTSFSAANTTALSGSIEACSYYLVQLASGANGSALPTAEATGTSNLSASGGKIALMSNATNFASGCPVGNANLIDFVGYGSSTDCREGSANASNVASAANALFRKMNGQQDDNDNGADFELKSVTARNSSSTPYCGDVLLIKTLFLTATIKGELVELTGQIQGLDPFSRYSLEESTGGDFQFLRSLQPEASGQFRIAVNKTVGETLYYRIANENAEGVRDYSSVVALTLPKTHSPKEVQINTSFLSIHSSTETLLSASLQDLQGRVLSKATGIDDQELTVAIPSVGPGLYILCIQSDKGLECRKIVLP